MSNACKLSPACRHTSVVHPGVHQAVSKIRQEIDKQSSSLKSLHMRLETSAQKHQDLSSQFEGLQLQVDATTESQKLLQHLSGVSYKVSTSSGHMLQWLWHSAIYAP